MIEFEKYMVCQYCNLILDNPYESKCCGKLFCSKCTQNIETENCSKCYKIQEFRQNSFIKRILNQMTLKCFFGCGQKLHSSNLRQHMIYCENREYRCHFCDEDFYYGIGKTNTNTNFIGKKKAFLLHLIENHDDRIIDFHEKIPKDEKFRFYNSKPSYLQNNIRHSDDQSNESSNNNIDNVNLENVEEIKESESYKLLVKEEEKDLSFSDNKDSKNSLLLPRSNHYYSFLEKMKLFDLPLGTQTPDDYDNSKKNYLDNITDSENDKILENNIANSNEDLIIKILDKGKNDSNTLVNNFLSHEYGVNSNCKNNLDRNRNVFSSNINCMKYDYHTDLEFEHNILKTYPNTENEATNETENKNFYSFSNKYLEFDKMESPEIYKLLDLKKNGSKENKNDLTNKDKEEQYSFSKIFIEESIEEEDKNEKVDAENILEDMYKITSTKDNDKKNNP